MNWQRRHALVAGLALVAITNVIALGGVAWNRTGEPESVLDLTERELWMPYTWSVNKDNSGLALEIQWRMLGPENGSDYLYSVTLHGSGEPEWLDESKMSALGFDVTLPIEDAGGKWNSRYQRQLSREVLLVLEFDGQSYQHAVARATRAAKAIEARNKSGRGKRDAEEMLNREKRESSRLFVVDAGLDRHSLRAQYPDRTKYAIVRGLVRPSVTAKKRARGGTVQKLSTGDIQVPLGMRRAFEAFTSGEPERRQGMEPLLRMRLAFGQRLEPWLVSARTDPKAR
jgi:hypothetical protein